MREEDEDTTSVWFLVGLFLWVVGLVITQDALISTVPFALCLIIGFILDVRESFRDGF